MLSDRARPNIEAAALVGDKIRLLELELEEAYAEMRKQRPAMRAVFNPEVWRRAERAAIRVPQDRSQ